VTLNIWQILCPEAAIGDESLDQPKPSCPRTNGLLNPEEFIKLTLDEEGR
jgi:hypothetical protein